MSSLLELPFDGTRSIMFTLCSCTPINNLMTPIFLFLFFLSLLPMDPVEFFDQLANKQSSDEEWHRLMLPYKQEKQSKKAGS